MEHKTKTKQPQHVSRARKRICSRCNAEPCIPGQRYGKICHAQASKDYRARQKMKRVRMHRQLSRMGKIIRALKKKIADGHETRLTPRGG